MKSLLKNLYLFAAFRTFLYRFGPAVWRLPSSLRWRLCSEQAMLRLPHAKRWRYGHSEHISPPALKNPSTFGHSLASRPYRLFQPFVAELEEVWLVGEHATPVTRKGRILLTAFRDQPGMLGCEPNEDLQRWVSAERWRTPRQDADFYHVCSFVNRLDPNYFHWTVEWCGQIRGLLHYQELAGLRPKILIRAGGSPFIRQSLELLGYGHDDLLEWGRDNEPKLVKGFIAASLPGNRVACSPQSLVWLRETFLQAVGIIPDEIKPHRKIYIARKKGGWRSVLNESDLLPHLLEEGFEVLNAEQLTFREQIHLFTEATLIVGLHGAGLTNILYAPYASMLELIGSYGDGTWYSMTTCLKQTYDSLLCQSVGDDVIVDIPELMQRLKSHAQQKSGAALQTS